MGLVVKPFTFSAGAVIIASEHNDNFDTLYNEFNGNIQNANVAANAAIEESKLDLSTLTQEMTLTNTFRFFKGANVASATSITLGAGNFFDITGTTDIETITAQTAGTVIWLRFNGTLDLIDDTGNLELLGANVTVNDEEIVTLISDGTNWNLVANSGTSGASTNITDLTIASEAQGDIIYRNATEFTRLAAGTAGQALTTGGAGANPAWAGMTTQGDVEYHNGTTRTRLAAGTSGQFLQTQGAGANPVWAGAGATELSANSISTGTNTGDIAISGDKTYRVDLALENDNASNTNELALRFDSDATVAAYQWMYNSIDVQSPVNVTNTSVNVAGSNQSIPLCDMGNDREMRGVIWFNTYRYSPTSGSDDAVFMHGEIMYYDQSNGWTIRNITGTWTQNSDVNDFEIFSLDSRNFSGNINVYEFSA
jgi:hypothetical protein